MADYKGRLFLLGLGDGADPEVFTTVACMRSTEFSVSAETVDITSKCNAPNRTLQDGSGIVSASISASGVFTDDATMDTLSARCLTGSVNNYKITSGRADSYTGAFQITSFSRTGEYNGDEQYSITLESAGAIVHTPAA